MSKTFLLALVCIFLLVIGQSLLKYGLVQVGGVNFVGGGVGSNLRKMFSTPYILLGFAFYGVSSLLWLGVLSKLDLSVAFPMASMAYVFTMISGAVIFHETITPVRVVSLILICLGVVLLGFSQ